MKMVLSLTGVFALTISAWALESGIKNSDNPDNNASVLLRISDTTQNCKLHDHNSITVDKRLSGVPEKNASANKTGRQPLPAERLGLMLKLSSL